MGIMTNQEDECRTCDSWLGFGAEYSYRTPITAGNYAVLEGDNGDRNTPAIAYILVF